MGRKLSRCMLLFFVQCFFSTNQKLFLTQALIKNHQTDSLLIKILLSDAKMRSLMKQQKKCGNTTTVHKTFIRISFLKGLLSTWVRSKALSHKSEFLASLISSYSDTLDPSTYDRSKKEKAKLKSRVTE